MARLIAAQQAQLHSWLADRIPYPKLVPLMHGQWHFVISSPGVTWHRQHHATAIAALHEEHVTVERRRAADRQRKTTKRLAGEHRHCPTCQCHVAS